MATLLDRAQALLASKPVLLGTLAIVPIATAAPQARAVPIPASPYSYDSGAVTVDYNGGSETLGSLTATPVGTTLSLSSDDPIQIFSSRPGGQTLHFVWSGTLDPNQFIPDRSTIKVHYDFSVLVSGVSGGSATWTLLNTIGGQDLDPVTGNGFDEHIVGDLSSPVTSPLTNTWTTRLDVEWPQYSQSTPSNLTVSVPAGASIDLSVVPEPASLSVLALGALGLLARRRRLNR